MQDLEVLQYNLEMNSITLRPKQPDCLVCGDTPSITEPIDYVQFCGSSANDKGRSLTVLDDSDRISCLVSLCDI